MLSCPGCQSAWSWAVRARHTWWTPIICPGCGGRFHFNKRQLLLASLPMVLSSFGLAVICLIGEARLGGLLYKVLGTGFCVLIIAFAFRLSRCVIAVEAADAPES